MADTVPLSRAKLAQNLSIQPKRLTHTEYRTLNRINRLTDEDALNWLLVEYGSRKKLPLAAILKRFSKLTRNRDDRARAADLADKLTRCGRIAARGTPRYRCGLNFCPLCQSNKENPTQARAQALVEAVLGKSPDRERLSYVTINADRILSGWEHTAARDFDNQIRQTMARFGHRAHGQYGYGLTGNLHAHMVVIHECSKGQLEADLKAVFRDKRQVLVEKLYETQSVGDAVKGIAVYDCAAVKNKDAKNESRWNIVNLGNWIVGWNELALPEEIELGFSRTEMKAATSIARTKLTPKRKPKPKADLSEDVKAARKAKAESKLRALKEYKAKAKADRVESKSDIDLASQVEPSFRARSVEQAREELFRLRRTMSLVGELNDPLTVEESVSMVEHHGGYWTDLLTPDLGGADVPGALGAHVSLNRPALPPRAGESTEPFLASRVRTETLRELKRSNVSAINA